MENLSMNLDDLSAAIAEKLVEETKTSFTSYVDAEMAKRRIIPIGSIYSGVGYSTAILIKFWNLMDEEKGIPVEDRTPITLIIDSDGGLLTDSFTVIDAIKTSKTPVHTVCIGAAYSGGFFIFIAGHKRSAYKLSSFLYHEGSTTNGGDAAKFRNFADFYAKQLGQLKQIVLENTKITPEQYQEHIKDDWWFTAKEALEYGICDEIIGE